MKLYRADGILNLESIVDKKIISFGAGSLGGMTLTNLAYPWRENVIVDPEDLDIENVERHVLGLSHLGVPKVLGMKEWLVNRGINKDSITAVVGYAQDVFDTHQDCDLALVNVGMKAAKEINSWCVTNNIPAIYGGIYPLGTGGEVVVIPNPKDTCYICAQEILGANTYQGKGEVNYGLNPDLLYDKEGEVKAVPALRHVVNEVAANMADMALQLLTGGEIPSQILIEAHSWTEILNIPSGDKLKPYARYILALKDAGVISKMRIQKNGKGFSFSIERGEIALKVERWDNCPFHSEVLSPDSI